MQIISALKQAIRQKSLTTNLVAITQLFDFLHLFASVKSSNTAIIYKILVFFLIEKHDMPTIREMMLRNFITAFKTF